MGSEQRIENTDGGIWVHSPWRLNIEMVLLLPGLQLKNKTLQD